MSGGIAAVGHERLTSSVSHTWFFQPQKGNTRVIGPRHPNVTGAITPQELQALAGRVAGLKDGRVAS